jgi:hypothetical protein
MRRVAESRWTAVLLVFAVFQWLWTSYLVSVLAAASMLVLLIVLRHVRWRPRDPERAAKWQWLRDVDEGVWVAPLFWGCIWTYYAVAYRPQRRGWALLAGAIFLLYSFKEFVDWRDRVRASRARESHEQTTSHQADAPRP